LSFIRARKISEIVIVFVHKKLTRL